MEGKTTRFLTFSVQYFKPSGKYYSSGFFSMEATTTELEDGRYSVYMEDAADYLRERFLMGYAPGLASWHNDFHALLDHSDGYPILINPAS